ncbi:MAG TPA: hypothetical protein VKY73_15785 [Polyangiaceae bacterium]|nr:hypothetical protein [Polyangiaceae bacterium]
MTVRILYRPFLHVHLWHDYALSRGHKPLAALSAESQARVLRDYSIHDHLLVSPTEETKRLLRGHRLVFRPTPTGFALYAAVEPSGPDAEPVLERPLDPDFVVRFTLDVRRPAFLLEANVPARPAGSVFHFTNASDNSSGGVLHLSRPVPGFSATASYAAGDLVVDDADAPTTLFEAASDIDPAPAPTGERWLHLPAEPYVAGTTYEHGDLVVHGGTTYEAAADGELPAPPGSSWRALFQEALRTGVTRADLRLCVPPRFRFELGEEVPYAEVRVLDRDGQTVLTSRELRRDGAPLSAVEIDLTGRAPGSYTLSVSSPADTPLGGTPLPFELHPDALRGLPFAILEIANLPSAPLTDAEGRLTAPEYHLRFRNRHAYWRYVFQDGAESPPADTGELVQEDPTDPSRFVTRKPYPLSAGVVDLKAFAVTRKLPNPTVRSLKKESGKYFQETIIHSRHAET